MQEKDSTFLNIILYNVWLFFGWKITVKMKKREKYKKRKIY